LLVGDALLDVAQLHHPLLTLLHQLLVGVAGELNALWRSHLIAHTHDRTRTRARARTPHDEGYLSDFAGEELDGDLLGVAVVEAGQQVLLMHPVQLFHCCAQNKNVVI
jgi:hypothetical protein